MKLEGAFHEVFPPEIYWSAVDVPSNSILLLKAVFFSFLAQLFLGIVVVKGATSYLLYICIRKVLIA